MRLKSNGSLTAAAYVRVSSDEQVEGYSLDAQQRAIEAYCDAQGWTLVEEYRDEGKSARTDDLVKRPAFSTMLEDADAGAFDVIVVHKLDRFSRNLRITLEVLDRLDKSNVSFVSISENMDFTSPIGHVILATLGAFAQYYSDNLSNETKKGKAERKRQGCYNGLLPFGASKDDEGIPVPCPENHAGLILAFEAAAEGKSDRQVAEILNSAGYRTTGNRGSNPWTKDSVRPVLQNRFYLGELPDGNGGWVPGQHEPLVSEESFGAAMATRERNRRSPSAKVKRAARTYSLSGISVCGHCGGRMHIASERGKNARIYCYNRRQGSDCPSKTTFLKHYEAQIADFLDTFSLPGDYQRRIMALYQRQAANRIDRSKQRQDVERRLKRIKDLYTWGDLDPADYQTQRDELTEELNALGFADEQNEALERTAELLANLPEAWNTANQFQRARLAQILLESVKIKDSRVEAVKPRPEFVPFFALDYFERRAGSCGSDGIRTRDLHLDRVAC